MIITVKGSVEKRCPYRDEVDQGTVTLTFDVPEGDGPELHDLADYLRGFVGQPISHEEFTKHIALEYPVTEVVTEWETAGLSVVVSDRRG